MRIRKFLKWLRGVSESGALMHNVRRPFEMYSQRIGDAYLSHASQDGPVYPQRKPGGHRQPPQPICLSTDDLYELLRIASPLDSIPHPDLADYAAELSMRVSAMSEQVDLPAWDEAELSADEMVVNEFYDLCEDVAHLTQDGYMIVTGMVDERLVKAAKRMLSVVGDVPDDGTQSGAMAGHARAVLEAYASAS